MLISFSLTAPFVGEMSKSIEPARTLIPALKGRKSDANKLRLVHAQTIRNLRSSQLYRMLRPVSLNYDAVSQLCGDAPVSGSFRSSACSDDLVACGVK